jgi:hypothetical protein
MQVRVRYCKWHLAWKYLSRAPKQDLWWRGYFFTRQDYSIIVHSARHEFNQFLAIPVNQEI